MLETIQAKILRYQIKFSINYIFLLSTQYKIRFDFIYTKLIESHFFKKITEISLTIYNDKLCSAIFLYLILHYEFFQNAHASLVLL